jgi:tetratricopeptide (TPR) repeat protein
MSEQTEKVEIIAGRAGIVVAAKKGTGFRVDWRLPALIVGSLAVLAIGIVLAVYADNRHKHTVAVKQQKSLQASISDANAVGNLNKLKNDSDALIAGAKSGTYAVSDQQLAAAYANKGDVAFNQANYTEAVADYTQAVKLDSSQQQLVGYNEFVARYHLGERKTLVPLLQTLQKPYKDNHDTGMQEHYDQYQTYIDDLQAGKELDV